MKAFQLPQKPTESTDLSKTTDSKPQLPLSYKE